MSQFPWRALPRPLADSDRSVLASRLRSLVKWQRDLRTWPTIGRSPDADPFVSLYASGSLRGCFGSSEGSAGERLQRAFLLASTDLRFAPIDRGERPRLVAQVSYALRPRRRTSSEMLRHLEVGTDGLAIELADGRRTAVLPDVARDRGLTQAQFLAAARDKIGLPPDRTPRGTKYFTFETELVTSRAVSKSGDLDRLAADWLARQVFPDGSIAFGVDPRNGDRVLTGQMLHGRSAAVVEALDQFSRHRSVVARARDWLGREIEHGLRGRRPDTWPEALPMVAGTLALALRAGIDVRDRLIALVRSAPEVSGSPWHAAQVVAALGKAAPKELWSACVSDLRRNPVAPWTQIAAVALGDRAAQGTCEAALVDAVRSGRPHLGAVYGSAVPETALTSMVITALRTSSGSQRVLEAVGRASAFLRRWQFAPGRVPGAYDPAHVAGAFPLSPVHAWLRTDVTAHALTALCGSRKQ